MILLLVMLIGDTVTCCYNEERKSGMMTVVTMKYCC